MLTLRRAISYRRPALASVVLAIRLLVGLTSPGPNGVAQVAATDEDVAEALLWRMVVNPPGVEVRAAYMRARVAVARLTFSSGAIEIHFDERGRVVRIRTHSMLYGDVWKWYRREYDPSGRLARIAVDSDPRIRLDVETIDFRYGTDGRMVSGNCRGRYSHGTLSIERPYGSDSTIVVVLDRGDWASEPRYAGEQVRLGIDARGRIVYDSLVYFSRWLLWRCYDTGYMNVVCYDSVDRVMSVRGRELGIEFPPEGSRGTVYEYYTDSDSTRVSEYWCRPTDDSGDWLDLAACPCIGAVDATPYQTYVVDEHGLPVRGNGWSVEYEFHRQADE